MTREDPKNSGENHSSPPLSDIQRRMMGCIEDYLDEQRRPPTNREIGTFMGIPSTGHVDHHLRALEKKGYIRRDANTSRGIHVVVSLRDPQILTMPPRTALPIMGTIAAGTPLELGQETDEQIEMLDAQSFKPNAYVLRVQGNSMIEDGIFNGDIVVVEPTQSPRTGDVIVAINMQEGERGAVTLKRFYQETRRVRLQPANSELDPIYVPAREWNHNWQVQGRLAAVVRLYR